MNLMLSDEVAEGDLATAASTYDSTTILQLHEYCWEAILSYLPIEDIVRSERVCRRWQVMVREYLQHVRIQIEYPSLRSIRDKTRQSKCRRITLKEKKVESKWFAQMTKKLGPLIVKSDCVDAKCLVSVFQYCSNIKNITVLGLQDSFLYDNILDARFLKRVSFVGCYFGSDLPRIAIDPSIPSLADICIGRILRNSSINELVIDSTEKVNGAFLKHLKEPNELNSLYLRYCRDLNWLPLLPAVARLTKLTTLDLSGNPVDVLKNIHFILNELPQLEELSLDRYKQTDIISQVYESLGKLKNLKRLSVKHNANVNDNWLEAVADGCKQLQAIRMQKCHQVTGPGLVQFCRGLKDTLTALSVMDTENLKDIDIVRCIRLCPNLQVVDVRGCAKVRTSLVAAVAHSAGLRRRPLHLRVWYTVVKPDEEGQTDGLTLDFDSDEDYYYD